jgi:hypothetical protein
LSNALTATRTASRSSNVTCSMLASARKTRTMSLLGSS